MEKLEAEIGGPAVENGADTGMRAKKKKYNGEMEKKLEDEGT